MNYREIHEPNFGYTLVFLGDTIVYVQDECTWTVENNDLQKYKNFQTNASLLWHTYYINEQKLSKNKIQVI